MATCCRRPRRGWRAGGRKRRSRKNSPPRSLRINERGIDDSATGVARPPRMQYDLTMGHIHRSRREILQSIPLLGSGALLRPLHAERPDTKTPGVIRGALRDGASGKAVAAKMRVVDLASGHAFVP